MRNWSQSCGRLGNRVAASWNFKHTPSEDVPGGPVAKTPRAHAGFPGSSPGQGTKSHMSPLKVRPSTATPPPKKNPQQDSILKQKINTPTPYDQPLYLRYFLRRNKGTCLHKGMCINVYHGSICKSQKLEAPQTSPNR